MTHEQTHTQPAQQPRVLAGRYAILNELGRGGMGVVWRGQDQVIGRQVAIKELHLPDGGPGAAVFGERVMREVRTGGKLNDPAVVTVYDVLNDNGTTYIVMELVEAPTLADVVRQYGPLPAQQVAAIGEQVLSALTAAHQAGIVHRDVKPSNIMVASNGRVKLADFGIAQAIDDPRITTSGMVVGSPAFMSPERVNGQEAMPESDLWALGATLFFAAEGTVAFERPTTAATLHAIMTEIPYLTRAQGPLASAIMGLLIASPEARLKPQQAKALLAMATSGSAQITAPVLSGRTTVAPAPSAKPKRGLWLSLVAVAAVVALVAGLFAGKLIWSPSVSAAMLPTMTYGAGGELLEFEQDDSLDCYSTPIAAGYRINSDVKVDCEKVHQFQIFDAYKVLETGSYTDDKLPYAGYPDLAVLKAAAEARCTMVFQSDAVLRDQRPSLQFRALVPTQQEWARDTGNDKERVRLAVCALTKKDGSQIDGDIVRKLK
ncbi:Serine/threonine protein kinase [Amycolatopsis xylanica]|uniref:non-specific serine/threonine protein kinase n=1 Tax=Amycolatopsis xylanica TaxID=589385 RepID=A0A1H3GFZ0_9PSEU|nr:serine/threonine-protein kinase [Amycolatopsis xylanica]SDY02206.1 Serine/threonine protein kinase [Amycolatopsis xylanica]